jgi:hypothetical protein
VQTATRAPATLDWNRGKIARGSRKQKPKKANMKTNGIAVIAGAFAMLNLTALAGPGPQDFPRRLAAKEEAMDCCKAGAKVALACKDCKNVEVAKDQKGVAAWFKKDSTHGCAGCGGKITVHQQPGGKGATYAT